MLIALSVSLSLSLLLSSIWFNRLAAVCDALCMSMDMKDKGLACCHLSTLGRRIRYNSHTLLVHTHLTQGYFE